MKSIFLFLVTFSLATAENLTGELLKTANTLFTKSVYNELIKNERGNFLVSPLSAEIVLAFGQSGARGESAEELLNALHLPTDRHKTESARISLLSSLKNNNLYTCRLANKMYVQENFSIRNDFKDTAVRVYQSDIEAIDFKRNVDAARTMNSWVEKHTENKIRNLINSNDLDENTRVVLINALYFKANWSNPFPLSQTENNIFYKTASQIIQVPTLHHYEVYFKYYECPHLKAQFLELPFNGGEASMVIVLPNEKDGLSSLEKQLDKVFSPQHEFKTEYLNVAIPKFKIESSIDFKKILQNLGVSKIFDEDHADLSGVAGNKGDLYVSKVAQKTFIDVSEEGVEAAAATYYIIAVPTSAHFESPKYFEANHPFIFYVKVKDIIIFAGRVTDPSKA